MPNLICIQREYVTTKKSEEVSKIRVSMPNLISIRREYATTKKSDEVSKNRGSIKNKSKYAKFDFHPEGVCRN